ncbi:MAG: pyridoxal-phosphate dependent enzyme [Flavobacteriaceae bacterium]|nr:pyridoxal-phosphate dependent enzyme [Flavobacteriaceae bacterium]
MEKQELLNALQRIGPHTHRTPVLTSKLLDEMSGVQLFFKCENFQRGGSYKIRGATNAVLKLSPENRSKGVVTHSSGNFAQALTLAAKSCAVKAHIVMPENAPEVKVNAVKTYGGTIYRCESTLEAREQKTEAIIARTGATFLHPSNDLNVIYGQGTAAMELLQDHPDLDHIFVPVGGGGLIAGSALAARYFSDGCKLIGGEPFEADDAYRSLISGNIESNETTNTIADGLRTQLGDKNFPIIQKHVSQIIRVTEEEIVQAMRFIWERMKIVVEPSSAVAFAALLREKKKFEGMKIGIVLSGGNVDLTNLPF